MPSRSPTSRLPVLILAAGLVLSACSDGPAGPGPGQNDPDPTPEPALVIQKAPDGAGDLQSALRGTDLPLPLRALVTRGGVPVSEVRVTWQVFLGPGGELAPQAELTDADGIASARFRVGAIGRSTILARLDDGPTTAFYPTAEPATIQVVSGNDQAGQVGELLPELLRIRVHFQGEPLAGEQLRWAGPGSVETLTPTDPSGETTARLTLGTVAGQQGFGVAAGTDPFPPGSSVRAQAQAGPGILWPYGASGGIVGAGTSEGQGYSLWGVHDKFGNPVSGAAVHWRVASGAATLAEATSLTGPDGYVYARFTAHNSADEILIGGMLPDGEELLYGAGRAWDMRFTCDLGCYLSPAGITRQAGDPIRLAQAGGQFCTFSTPVAGLPEVVPTEFSIAMPGTYGVRCGEPTNGYLTGAITIVP